MNRPRRNEDYSEDSPPHSRLFIVCEKRFTEDDFRKAFSKFGTIEDIRMPRDHRTGEMRGVAYLKFSKTTEAAAAIEDMHKKTIIPHTRPLKVMVATNRSEIHTDDNTDDKFRRLFITIPYVQTEDDIFKAFSPYGHVESVVVQRDRNTGEPKGFAYVTFSKFLEAATAFEKCDRKFRAIFAMPKGSYNRRSETAFETKINDLAKPPIQSNSLVAVMNATPKGYTRVDFMCCPQLSHRQVESLFDIVPGLVDCRYYVDMIRNFGKGSASYSNPVSAAHAVDKLNEFEYPPGMKIFVKPDKSEFDHFMQSYTNVSNVTRNLKKAIQSANTSSPDLAQLAEAIAEASKLIKLATTGVTDDHTLQSNDLNYCSVKLPPQQPLADIDSVVAKRCFLVCKPQPPPLTVLRDIFCRFGDLINVYTLPNKTVGYARYASEKAANDAMSTLHGAEVCGVRIKVLEAEDEAPAKKRRWTKGEQDD
ncbi:unnamed protein product [Chrysodeixis includens]|uniref:RRM domain-containing protein n=1 Tax=Chrysodeixis includens TaxID=689277 RepID=A0A9N8KS92_CHRIL|nr:unnamed protein product [Chrysodeixis includens]